jgi:hypothetical protein
VPLVPRVEDLRNVHDEYDGDRREAERIDVVQPRGRRDAARSEGGPRRNASPA